MGRRCLMDPAYPRRRVLVYMGQGRRERGDGDLMKKEVGSKGSEVSRKNGRAAVLRGKSRQSRENSEKGGISPLRSYVARTAVWKASRGLAMNTRRGESGRRKKESKTINMRQRKGNANRKNEKKVCKRRRRTPSPRSRRQRKSEDVF